jgi:peptidoglycan/LPS O-acetylase OafA/YrhL
MAKIPFGWGNFAVNLVSLQGVFGDPFPLSGALWSLSYEVWFYVLCGAVLCVAIRGSRVRRAAAVVAALAAAWVFTRLDAAYLVVWLFGAASYFLPRLRAAAGVVLIPVGIALTEVTSETKQADFSRFRVVSHDVAILLLGLGIAAVLPALATAKVAPSVAKVARFFAGFSYSLYLIHLPAESAMLEFGLLRRHTVMDAGALAGYVGLACAQLVVAWLFYYCFERQTDRLRRYSSGRPDSLSARQPPSSEMTFV